MRNIAVVLPITEPSDKHYHFVRQLSGEVRQVIVVDDGAEEEKFLKQMQAFSNVTVLHHLIPRGVGLSFRTAFEYLINHGRSLDAAVLVRDTETLSVEGVRNTADQFITTTAQAVLGEVNDSDVPTSLEKLMLKWLESTVDVEYQTLQMPMMACDRSLFGYLSTLPGNDDEYLFNLLLLLGLMHVAFVELPIEADMFEWEASKATLAKAAKDVQDDPGVLLVP